jgi:uncharacterized protein (DUF697 family)
MAEEAKKENDRSADAAKIIRNHALASVAAGMVPIPLVPGGILIAVHLRMAHKLAELYEVEWDERRAESIIGSLVGISAATTAFSVLKMIPGTGSLLLGLGALTLPSASTYALGRVLVRHFESGGTFLAFDAKRAKKEYDEDVEAAKKEPEPSYIGVRP